MNRPPRSRPRPVRQGRRDVRDMPLREAGVFVGHLRVPGTRPGPAGRGPELRMSWEDVGLAVMAPRSWKTTGLAITQALEAPGAAVVTSNKADVWLAIHAIRAQDTGERVWGFDPQQVAHVEQTW